MNSTRSVLVLGSALCCSVLSTTLVLLVLISLPKQPATSPAGDAGCNTAILDAVSDLREELRAIKQLVAETALFRSSVPTSRESSEDRHLVARLDELQSLVLKLSEGRYEMARTIQESLATMRDTNIALAEEIARSLHADPSRATQQGLIFLSAPQIISRLGPPIAINPKDNNAQEWVYLPPGGKKRLNLILHNSYVVQVHARWE